MSRLNTLLFQLSFFVPLVALLLVSLALVVLKRRSGYSRWLSRLLAPPFYLVSLPIATLIVGAEMLGWYSHVIFNSLLSPYGFHWIVVFYRFQNVFFASLVALLFYPDYSYSYDLLGLLVFVVLIGFWAATFASGYLLWRAVWREDHDRPTSRIAMQRLQGLLLLACFAWAFCYLVSYVVGLLTPLGISVNH
jgi:hypothetical protein